MKTKLDQLKLTKKGYGHFPYIILRIARTYYMQIPIQFLRVGGDFDINKYPGTQIRNVPEEILSKDREAQIDLLHDKIMEASRFVIGKLKDFNGKEPELCIVLGKNRAIYYSKGEFKESSSIPTGGILINQVKDVLAMNAEHYLETQ